MRVLLPVLCSLVIGCSPNPDEDPDTTTQTEDGPSVLDDFLESQRLVAGVPGLSVAMVRDGAVLWTGAYGLADENNQLEVTTDTAFMLASVSKTVTGVALMQLYEEGLFALDDDVNDALAFSVENPNFPGEPITYRQLLSHTSSIRDNWNVMDGYYVDGDSPVALGDFLEDYLDPSGSEYNADRNYQDWGPAEDTTYSNIGAALAGHMVEVLSGVPFDQHCEEQIFVPLAMEHTGWHLSDFANPATEVAFPHDTYYGEGRVPHFGYPDYPDGQLRSSASDIGAFLAAFANDGVSADGVRILEASTVALMEEVQSPATDGSQGLIWYYETVDGEEVVGHNGGDTGTSTDMYYREADTAGFVALMNGEPSEYSPVEAMHALLLQEATSF